MAANDAAPQLSFTNRVIAGILLVFFTAFPIVVLIAFWPDRIPEPTEKCALYQYSWFDMRLDTAACSQWAVSMQAANHPASTDSVNSKIDTAGGETTGDTPQVTLVEKSASSDTAGASHHPSAERGTKAPKHIHLNTILLIMVATGGFLGNMIHIATSFTTFIGAGSFRKSWILWYWVRPFTASALALALYFAFGASNNPGNVDIDRTLTIAVLAGLFTDIATQKLKEVFDVIFNPKQNRPDPLATTGFLIADDDTEPDTLVKDADNTIVIYGRQLTAKNLVIKMEDTAIANASITDSQISFTYTLADADKDKEKLTLVITDAADKEVYRKDFPIQGNSSDAPEADTGNDTDADEKPVG